MRRVQKENGIRFLALCAVLLMMTGTSLTASPYAERAFAGVGVNYIMPSVSDMPKLQNTTGFKLTWGYQVNPSLAFIFDYNIVPSLKNNDEAVVYDSSSRYYTHIMIYLPPTEASIRSFSASLRYSFDPLSANEAFRPYIAGGLGSMRVKIEKMASVPADYAHINLNTYYEGIGSVSDLFLMLTAGMEYQFNKDMSALIELEYLTGSGDLDEYSHVAIGARLAYHF